MCVRSNTISKLAMIAVHFNEQAVRVGVVARCRPMW